MDLFDLINATDQSFWITFSYIFINIHCVCIKIGDLYLHSKAFLVSSDSLSMHVLAILVIIQQYICTLPKILHLYIYIFCFRSWQFNLRELTAAKVEGVTFEYSFMSERASLFLLSVGLLGEYCPTSRKKCSQADCMHLEPCLKFKADCVGCYFMQPKIFSKKPAFLPFWLTSQLRAFEFL